MAGVVALALALFQKAVTPVAELPKAVPAKEIGPADVLLGSIGLIGGLFILRRRAAAVRDGAEEPQGTRLRLSEPPSETP